MAPASKYTEDFKKKVAEAAEQEGATLKAVGEKFGVNPTLVRNWKLKYRADSESSSDDSSFSKYDAFDEEKNPDGISEAVSDLEEDVWDRGYYCETDDGTWYEMYANERLREAWGDFELSDPDEIEMFESFNDFDVSMFEEYGQITFFVPKGDTENDLDALTEIFI